MMIKKNLTAEQIFSIEDLKCCGNCGIKPSVSNLCRYFTRKNRAHDICEHWEFDLMTREDRIKENKC